MTYDLALAIETALRRHPAISAAEARSQAAKTAISVAGAENRPVFEGFASTGRTVAGDRTLFFREGVPGRGFAPNPFYTTSLDFVSPLIREGSFTFLTLPSEKIAIAHYDLIQYDKRQTRNQVVSDATVAFFTTLSAIEQVVVSKQLVEFDTLVCNNARLKFEQHLLTRAEILEAESALVSAKADLEVARAALTSSLEGFANTLGIDPSTGRSLELVNKNESLAPVAPLSDLLTAATSRHPLVLAQQARVAEASVALERVRAERYPTLDAVASVGVLGGYQRSVEFWSTRASVRMEWKVFDFGALDLRIKQQAEVLEAETKTLERVKNQVDQPVILAYRDFTSAQARVTAAEKSVELAQEVERSAHEKFQQDLIPPSDLMNAEVNLANARKGVVQTTNALGIDHALLQLAVGSE